jgi:hypothetical protein
MAAITDGSYKSSEKKDFTPEEFTKAKATCEFVIDFTKAISRSGYYDASHPVSLDVKKGLYATFLNILVGSPELMLTCHDVGEQVDIYISGILEEPFNIRKLTKENTLDLFVPKLKDYFERKSLNSFAIKKNITIEHFESFIDVMSEPIGETADGSTLGDFLTKSLVELNITEVSTVFKTDIVLRAKLPWRVAIILRRLAKDLKVLPMFKDASADKIKEIKKQIVGDIIRPLNNNELLRDLLVNCDIIAVHLDQSSESDELQEMIISAFRENEIIPVTQAVFDVYKENKKPAQSDEENQKHQQKCDYLARVLCIAAKQIAADEIPDAADLFKELYEHKIIKFEMLPEEIRFNIQSVKMAGDVISRIDLYIASASKTTSLEEMESLIVVFHRVTPELIRLGEWDAVSQIVKVICGFASRVEFASSTVKSFSHLPDSIFEGAEEVFAHKYMSVEPDVRNQINEILMQMTSMCIKIADVIFDKCKDPNVLKNIIDILSKKGEPARQWCIKILNDKNQPVSMLNYALLLIINVGQIGDAGLIKHYVKHSNHSIRSKALGAMVKLDKKDVQDLAIDALNDEEEKVRSYAANIIERELSLSKESVNRLLQMIKERLQNKKDLTIHDAGLTAGLIRATGRAADGVNKEHVENEIIGIASDLMKGRSGLLKFIKTELTREQLEIISACLSTLGKTGGAKSRDYLKTLPRSDEMLAKVTREAMDELNKKSA